MCAGDSAADGRTKRHEGYVKSRKRRRLGEAFFELGEGGGRAKDSEVVKWGGRKKVGRLIPPATGADKLARRRNLRAAIA